MDGKLFLKIKSGNSDRQLIFFTYLGGSVTSMNELSKALKTSDIEVWAANPPGHMGSQLPLEDNMTRLVDMYADELKEIIKPECYLFGHSMGGNIAYFLARKLYSEEKYKESVKALILSSSSPPLYMYQKKCSELSDDALIAEIDEYKALPAELIESRELMLMLMPVFRADYRLIESSSDIEITDKLPINMYLIWGENDLVEPVEALPLWEHYIANPFMILPIKDAEHMTVHHNIDAVSEYIDNIIEGKYNLEEDE